MPLDHGRRFDQHDGVQGLRPDPVKPHPKKSVCAEEPRTTWALTPQDGHLVPKGDNLKLQGGAAAEAEGKQGNQGGKNQDHTHNDMAAAQKTLGFRTASGF
jgi:hypothetical protein